MFWPMSFTTTMFDDLILEVGELATLREEALRHAEMAASPALKEAVQSLAEAVTAMAAAALADGSAPQVALARVALSRAQRLFGPVNAVLTEARAEAERRAPTSGSPASSIQTRMRFREPPPWTG
jgi:hypothetical protein